MRNECHLLRCNTIRSHQAVPPKPANTRSTSRVLILFAELTEGRDLNTAFYLRSMTLSSFCHAAYAHGEYTIINEPNKPTLEGLAQTDPNTPHWHCKAHQVITMMPSENCDIARMMPRSSTFGVALGLCTTVYTLTAGSSHRARSASCHITGVRPNSCAAIRPSVTCSG